MSLTRSALFGALAALVAACGPSIRTAARYEWKPYDANEFKQAKDGLIVENRDTKGLPDQFYAMGQACNASGIPLVNERKEPVMEKFSIARPGQLWYQVVITNENEHVVRMNSAVVRVFDPAGNASEPLSKEDLVSNLLAARPCPSTNMSLPQFKLIKMFDRNVEILPKTSWTGWVVVQPPSTQLPGTWKLALYDLPTQTDPAGNVTRRTRFELRAIVTKYIDTYQTDSILSGEKLVKSEAAKE